MSRRPCVSSRSSATPFHFEYDTLYSFISGPTEHSTPNRHHDTPPRVADCTYSGKPDVRDLQTDFVVQWVKGLAKEEEI